MSTAEGPDRVVFVPADNDTERSLKSGEVDFIFPQAYTGIDAELSDPNIKYTPEPGGQFEALCFQQEDACTPDDTRSCAFADDDYRAAFSKSIDLQGVYDQIYAPFSPGAARCSSCGPIAPGTVLRSGLRGHLRPGSRREDPDRRRLDQERRRHVGEGRRGPGDPLDGQHRQHPS